jgi:NAD+ diphosphatase
MRSPLAYCPVCATALVDRLLHAGTAEERTRRVCPNQACGWTHWDNPVPVVAAVVEIATEAGAKIILVQNRGWPDNWWGLVTGFLERGEHPEAAVVREVQEELGLAGRVAGFIGHYDYADMNQLIIAYHVVAEGEVALGDELQAFKPVPLEKLKPWPFATGLAVADFLKRR